MFIGASGRAGMRESGRNGLTAYIGWRRAVNGRELHRNGVASVDRLRLRRGERTQLEFTVVVEEPVFHQIEPAAAVE